MSRFYRCGESTPWPAWRTDCRSEPCDADAHDGRPRAIRPANLAAAGRPVACGARAAQGNLPTDRRGRSDDHLTLKPCAQQPCMPSTQHQASPSLGTTKATTLTRKTKPRRMNAKCWPATPAPRCRGSSNRSTHTCPSTRPKHPRLQGRGRRLGRGRVEGPVGGHAEGPGRHRIPPTLTRRRPRRRSRRDREQYRRRIEPRQPNRTHRCDASRASHGPPSTSVSSTSPQPSAGAGAATVREADRTQLARQRFDRPPAIPSGGSFRGEGLGSRLGAWARPVLR